jgi:hypothetical protein
MPDNDGIGGGVLAGIVGLLVLVLIGVVVWQAGWLVTEKNEKRQGKIENIHARNIRKGYEYQQTLRGNITRDIEGVVRIQGQIEGEPPAEQETLANQRLAQVSTVCSEAQEIQGEALPSEQQKFISTNCEDGAVSPTSPYQKGK